MTHSTCAFCKTTSKTNKFVGTFTFGDGVKIYDYAVFVCEPCKYELVLKGNVRRKYDYQKIKLTHRQK